jgi:PAP2 superfamily
MAAREVIRPTVMECNESSSARAAWLWKAAWLAPVIAVLYGLYLLTNRCHLRPPVVLPLTAVDRAVPLLEWTVWPYLLMSGLMVLPLLARRRDTFLRALGALICGYSVNLLVFAFFPTVYPRPVMAEPLDWTGEVFRMLHELDSPANCFPSGHITAPFIGVWALARDFPAWRLPLWATMAVMSLAILTTKQHYAVDLPGGALTAIFGLWAERKTKLLRRYVH